MNGQFAVVLGLLLSGAALLAGDFAQRGELYFPRELESQTVACDVERWPFEVTSSVEPIMYPGESDWYDDILGGMDERSLYVKAKSEAGSTALRFTWIRSFHAPIVVRVESDPSGTVRLEAKQASLATGHRTFLPERRVQGVLSAGETKALELAAADAFRQPEIGCVHGADGAIWLLERTEGHDYKMMRRWSPREGPAKTLGLAMIALTGWDVGPVY